MIWQTKKLSELCDISNGLWTGKEPPYINVGVIRNTNFTKEGRLDYSNIANLDVEKNKFDKRKLVYGDIILEKSGGGPKQPVGRVVIFDKKEDDFSFSNFTSAIRVKNSKELDYNFLHKFLYFSYISGVTEKMQSHSTGIRNLDLNAYKEIGIPVPPLAEQRRIVKILDEVFAEIARAKENIEKNLQNSKDLFNSYIDNIFANPGINSEQKKLSEIATIKGGKRVPRGYKFESSKTNHAYISVLAFTDSGTIDLNKLKHISDDVFKQIKNYTITSNDLYISIAGTIGKTGIIPKELNGANLTENACKLIFHKGINPQYVYFFTKTSDFLNQAGIQTRVAAMPKLALSRLSNIYLKLPKLEQQNKIVIAIESLVGKTKKLEEIYKQKLTLLEELKKSLLHQAFSGKL